MNSLGMRAVSWFSTQMMFLSFFLLIACGNLLRMIPLFANWNHLLLTECSLYCFCLLSALFFPLSRVFLKKLILFSGALVFSFLYGAWEYGFDQKALFYVGRLFLLLFSAKILSEACLKKFQGETLPFFSWLLKGYFVAALISFCLYLLFPESAMLWQVLAEYGIEFSGDPHCNRLVSIYFDPNFYAAIGCIPFLLSSFLFSLTKKARYLLFAILIAMTIFLTESRSGIALFCSLVGWMGLSQVKKGGAVLRFSKKQFLFFLIFASCGMGALIYIGSFSIVMDRILGIGNDPSAGVRWIALKQGWEVLCQVPLLGMGYNFVDKAGLWIDSSVLLLAVSFGVCFTLFLIAYLAFLLKKFHRDHKGTALQPFVSSFVFYISFSVVFYSWFNNLLLYLFWALPVLVIYHFLKEGTVYVQKPI